MDNLVAESTLTVPDKRRKQIGLAGEIWRGNVQSMGRVEEPVAMQ
jgi:hypothetical protein